MDMKNLVEVLLFASPEPLTQSRFNHILQDGISVKLTPIIDELNSKYKKYGKGLKIQTIVEGYQILSQGEYHVDRKSVV